MSFLKQFFGVREQPVSVEQVAPVKEVCQFTEDSGDCSLVQQLKQKQAEKRDVDAKIKSYESTGAETVPYFLRFLVSMEQQGLEMERNFARSCYDSRIYYDFHHRCGTARLEEVLCRIPDNEINLMFEELRSLKNKAQVVGEYWAISKKLGEEISELKIKLVIE